MSRIPKFWPQIRRDLVDKYNIIDHDDATLGPPIDQLRKWASADAVVAPHGAGLINMLAMSPGACVIEFVPANHAYPHFFRLAGQLNLSYSGTLYDPDNTTADIPFLHASLRHCYRLRQPL